MSESQIPLNSSRGSWLIAATSLGSGMIFLDSTVVNVALPRIQSDFSAPLSGLQWVVNSYLLLLAALLMVGGDLGDRYGRRKMFAIGQVIFVAASVGCALSPSLAWLVAWRAFQGVGGALMVPESLAIIKAVIVEKDSSRAIGMWTGFSGVTAAIGPLVGGYLVGAVSWRAIFFINVAVGAVTLYATLAHIPANRDRSVSGMLDWPGALLAVIGLGTLTYGLIQGPQSGWTSLPVLVALGTGGAALLGFPLREHLAGTAMVPLSVFRSRDFSISNVATLAVYFAFSGSLLFLTLLLQQVEGYTPLQAGAAALPISLLILVLSPRVGGLTTRLGARPFMTVGPIVVAVGLVLFLLVGRGASYPLQIFPPVAVMGLGMSIFITPLTSTVMSSVRQGLVGVASGFNNTVSRVASLLAIAILGIVVTWQFDAVLPAQLRGHGLPASARSSLVAHRDRLADDPIPPYLSRRARMAARAALDASYVNGFHWAMALCALLCTVSGILCWLGIRHETSGGGSS